MQTQTKDHYNLIISTLETELKKSQKVNTFLFILRFTSFLLSFFFIFLYFKFQHESVFLFFTFVLFVVFIVSVNLDSKNSFRLKFLRNKLLVNNSELKFLNHQFTERETGNEFNTLNPHLAADFEIFGTGSLFQYLNRCSTKIGERKLAEDLCNQQKAENLILEKQKAILELSGRTAFIQDFQAYGLFFSETGNELPGLQSWLDDASAKLKWLVFYIYTIPLFNLSWIVLVASGILSFTSLLLPIIISLLIVFIYHKTINNAHVRLGNTAKTFEKYNDLIKVIENQEFESLFLKELKNGFVYREISASQSLTYLNKLLHSFDIRYNVIVSFFLNSFLVFDLQIFYRLILWKEKYKNVVPQWFASLSQMDALISFSVYAFNNKDSVCLPEISKKDFTFHATEMGHPLLPRESRICNNLNFTGMPSVVVITGANMAGKSTFLRTISINLILAMNGAPVCAKEFSFTPCDIMSSIKIQDSLFRNESYFYAELLRIKDIIEHVKTKPKTIVVLDEILRGTNTKDKKTGSVGILEKLISLNSVVIIATHDLSIGELEKVYPGIVANYCFEVELTNDQLIFDYKLKEGVSQKMNASFLMKKLQIID
jgi:DNA mismatch repair ATPase MutS